MSNASENYGWFAISERVQPRYFGMLSRSRWGCSPRHVSAVGSAEEIRAPASEHDSCNAPLGLLGTLWCPLPLKIGDLSEFKIFSM